MDYKNGKIYKLICSETQQVYIGSTCSTLVKRLYQHKKKSNGAMSKTFIEPKIYLVEDFSCERKEQLTGRERYYIENFDCVNKRIPGRTNKEWYKANKEIILQRKKEYREKNKEILSEKAEKAKKDKYTCDCGSTIRKVDKTIHFKTKKHLNFLANK